MSRTIGMNAVNLIENPRPGHTEYSLRFPSMRKAVLGKCDDTREESKEFYDALGFDFIFSVSNGPVSFAESGRVTDMGHAVYAEGGTDKREIGICPFEAPEEVWEFDAVKEYGLLEHKELVNYYEDYWQENQALFENQLFTGGRYVTIISGAIQAFGWDMLLLAASDADKFARVLRSFADLTMHHVKAWAETNIEVFLQHDDFVWTEGPFVNPSFYREVIIAEYKKFWDVLHRAGKKVLFCSDGRYDMFMDDIVAAGADGLIFEPCNDFRAAVKKYGKTHCLIGSGVDCRTMTFRPWDDVKAEMDATFDLVPDCAGLIWAVGNHIPSNVPLDICFKYLNYFNERTDSDLPILTFCCRT